VPGFVQNCLPNGGGLRQCSWGGYYEQTSSNCPLTLHYQAAEQLGVVFAARDGGQRRVCIPAEPLPWRRRTSSCDCFARADAIRLANADPEVVAARPPAKLRGEGATTGAIINATLVLGTDMMAAALKNGLGLKLGAAAVRQQVEDKLEKQLFAKRKLIKAVLADVEWAGRKAGPGGAFGTDLAWEATRRPDSALSAWRKLQVTKREHAMATPAQGELPPRTPLLE